MKKCLFYTFVTVMTLATSVYANTQQNVPIPEPKAPLQALPDNFSQIQPAFYQQKTIQKKEDVTVEQLEAIFSQQTEPLKEKKAEQPTTTKETQVNNEKNLVSESLKDTNIQTAGQTIEQAKEQLVEETQNESELLTTQKYYTNYRDCIKNFDITPEKLYYLTLSSISANKYYPIEAQTRAGYILFSTGKKEFLASITKGRGETAVLKISPSDNSYYFKPIIVENLFNYIDLKQNQAIATINLKVK